MECLKELVPLIESMLTSAAIGVGGWWTWRLYVRQRLHYPKSTVAFDIFDTCLPGGKRLIHVSLKIVNTGNVILKPTLAELRLRKVVPIDDTLKDVRNAASKGYDPVSPGEQEIEWPLIVKRDWSWTDKNFEIEPGEDDSLHADFIIDARIKVIQLYSFIKNPTKKRPKLGWTVTQMHEFEFSQKGKQMKDNSDDKQQILNGQQEQERIQQPQQKQQEPKQKPKPPANKQNKK